MIRWQADASALQVQGRVVQTSLHINQAPGPMFSISLSLRSPKECNVSLSRHCQEGRGERMAARMHRVEAAVRNAFWELPASQPSFLLFSSHMRYAWMLGLTTLHSLIDWSSSLTRERGEVSAVAIDRIFPRHTAASPLLLTSILI